MILTCPSCATSYFVPDDAVGPNGRTVRCKSCGHGWRAQSDAPLELTAAVAEAGFVHQVAAAGPGASDESHDALADTLAETPAGELPGAFRARAEQQRRLRRAAAHGAVWAGLASVFAGLLGAAWLFRVEVVDIMPQAAAAYAAVGAPVNRTGLEFEAVSARAAPNDPGKVVISGAVRNVRDREIQSPPVRVALLDAHGGEIAHALVRIDAAPVLPGRVQGFAVVLDDPGARGAGVGVDFALNAPVGPAAPLRPARVPPPARTPPQAEAPVEPPAETPAPAPTDELNLRPATAPMEARPAASPFDSGLDRGGPQAVSARDHG